jgi:hypothetical protein
MTRLWYNEWSMDVCHQLRSQWRSLHHLFIDNHMINDIERLPFERLFHHLYKRALKKLSSFSLAPIVMTFQHKRIHPCRLCHHFAAMEKCDNVTCPADICRHCCALVRW